jgi:hypothetical protein
MRANPILCLQVGHDGRSAMADEIRITRTPYPDGWHPACSGPFGENPISVGAGRACQMSGLQVKKSGPEGAPGSLYRYQRHQPGGANSTGARKIAEPRNTPKLRGSA